jgi:hypothetical protein
MGRLTLNVLLSFAQFEREVTGERIRDKIAASKKKGIWVGGIIPFGYRLENRKLLIEENEAKVVRLIFERYLELGSIRALEQELHSAGMLTRRRELSTGNVIGGIPFTQGPIAHILKNRTYIGELNHRKNSYPADHAPIVSRELFDAVQKQLEAKRNTRAEKHQASGALLMGKLFDQYGRPMTPTYACKGARRYRYYVSRPWRADSKSPNRPIIRIRAEEVERAIMVELAPFTDLPGEGSPRVNSVLWQGMARSNPNDLDEYAPDRQLIVDAVECVMLRDSEMELTLTADVARSAKVEKLSIRWSPAAKRLGRDSLHAPADRVHEGTIHLDAKTRASLVRSIARGRTWLRDIVSGKIRDVSMIATREKLIARSAMLTVSLAFLAPEIVEAAVEGRLRRHMGQRLLSALPLSWEEQHNCLASDTNDVSREKSLGIPVVSSSGWPATKGIEDPPGNRRRDAP